MSQALHTGRSEQDAGVPSDQAGSSIITWPAVTAIARVQLRRNWRQLIVLGLLVGVLAGAAVVSAQVARRTATAYDRLVDTVQLDDARLVIPNPDKAELAEAAALPGVQESWTTLSWVGQVIGHGVNYLDLSAGSAEPRNLVTPVIVSGRAADPSRADEIVLGEPLAQQVGLQVGDQLTLALLTTEEIGQFDVGFGEPDGPTVDLAVVGIARLPAWGNGISNASTTPAFAAQYGDRAGLLSVFFRLAPDAGSRAAFDAAAREFIAAHPTDDALAALGPIQLQYPTAELDPAVQAGAQFLQIGLLTFGGLLAMAGLLVLTAGLYRRAADQRMDQRIEAALGMTRLASVLARTLPAVTAAAVAGVLTAAIGLAAAGLPAAGGLNRFEPTPGFVPNAGLIAAVALAVVVLVLLAAAGAAAFAGRSLRSGAGVEPANPIAPRLWRRAEVTAGLLIATGRSRVRWSAVGRSFAIALVVGSVLAAATFGASLDRVVDSPERYGWSADAVIFDLKPAELSTLAANPWVAAVDVVTSSTVRTSSLGYDDQVTAYGFEHAIGELPWWVIQGRLPQSPNEVAVGTVVAERYALTVGSSWLLPAVGPDSGAQAESAGGGTEPPAEGSQTLMPFTVVGIVTPLAALRDGLGDSALFTTEGLDTVAGISPTRSAYVQALPRVAGALTAELAQRVEIQTAAPPAQIADLAQIRTLPTILAIVMAALAVLTAGVLSFNISRRRVRDLATLSVLGFTAGQRRAVLLWAAALITVPGVLVGIAVGIGAGRLLWSGLARASGVGGDAIVPVWIALGLALLIFLVAGVAAVSGVRRGASDVAVLRVE